MSLIASPEVDDAVREIARATPGLDLLLLYDSPDRRPAHVRRPPVQLNPAPDTDDESEDGTDMSADVTHGPGAEMPDWGLAYLGDYAVDHERLRRHLVDCLGSHLIELHDLSCASGQLRFRAASDGIVLFERAPGLVSRFRLDAALFWCNVAPLQRDYNRLLMALTG